jgi:hypothetical protein
MGDTWITDITHFHKANGTLADGLAGRIRILRLDNPSRIEWGCPLCDDQGVIYNWEGSMWDVGGRESTP